MEHLKALAHHLTEQGFPSTYLGPPITDLGIPGYHRIRTRIGPPYTTHPFHIYATCQETKPHIIVVDNHTTIDLNDPNSITQILDDIKLTIANIEYPMGTT